MDIEMLLKSMEIVNKLLNKGEIERFKLDSDTGYFYITAEKLTWGYSDLSSYESDKFKDEFHYEEIADTDGKVIFEALESWKNEFYESAYEDSGYKKFDQSLDEYWRKKGA